MRTTQWFRREGNMAEKQSDKTYQQKRKRMITITAVVVLVIFIGYTILGSLLSAVYAKDSTPEGDGEIEGRLGIHRVFSGLSGSGDRR